VIPVMLSEKGRWMERKTFSKEEMEDTANDIRRLLK
jgi:hypothetical protein